jgi:hypothetical protein
MKHENNFLLYSLASAFLMVSGMMLVSRSSFEHEQYLLANIVTVTAVVPEKEEYQTYSIQGDVAGLSLDSRQVVTVSLWREGGSGFMRQIDSVDLNNATGFSYSFEGLRAGLYAVKLETSDGVDVVQPRPFIQGIGESSHIIFISTTPNIVDYTDIDFKVLESL